MDRHLHRRSGLHLVDPHDVTIHLLSELGVILLLFLRLMLSVAGCQLSVQHRSSETAQTTDN